MEQSSTIRVPDVVLFVVVVVVAVVVFAEVVVMNLCRSCVSVCRVFRAFITKKEPGNSPCTTLAE